MGTRAAAYDIYRPVERSKGLTREISFVIFSPRFKAQNSS
jgi:hypothetical protein